MNNVYYGLNAVVLVVLSLATGGFTAPEVRLGNTTVLGLNSSTVKGVEIFAGIPFAKPPLGGLRFQPPVLETSLHTATFDATAFGLGCTQLASGNFSEDCLTINVYRPSGEVINSALPILFWIYGGDFVVGAGSDYDGSRLVARSVERGTPMIFVSFNYRLGPLGFPQGAEAGRRHALNLGLKDQLVAMQWVHANIGPFGGDKTKVTVAGISAGARSIDVHILGGSLKHLARGLIMQSSYRDPQWGPRHAQADWDSFVAAIPECASVPVSKDKFPCLQAANSSMLEAWINSEGWFQSGIDGPGGLMIDLPSRVTPLSRLPIILGTTMDEGTHFVPQETNSTEEIRTYLNTKPSPSPKGPKALAKAAEKILHLYPDDPSLGSPFGTGNETFGLNSQFKRYAAILGDFTAEFHRRDLAQTFSQAGVSTFAYRFSDPDAVPPSGVVDNPAPRSLGISHGSDLPYVFGGNTTTSSAKSLSTKMMDYWISFVTSLDPNDANGAQRPRWNEYTSTTRQGVVLQLDGHNLTHIPDTYRDEQISFIISDPVLFHR